MFRFNVRLSLVVFLCSSCPVLAFPQPSLERIGHYGGSPYAVTRDGDRLYVGVGARLRIYDISTANQPVLVGEVVLQGLVRDIAVEENLAYVATWGVGLFIVDVSNAATPNAIGSIQLGNGAITVAVSGNHAFLAGYELFSVNVANPASPVLASSFPMNGAAVDIAIRDNVAYVSGVVLGDVNVFDISNPDTPNFLNTTSVPGFVGKMVLRDELIVYSAYGDGLGFLSLADPIHPAFLGTHYYAQGTAIDVALEGNYAYLCSQSHGVVVVEISNPQQPVFMSTFPPPFFAWNSVRIEVYNGITYLANQARGLDLIDENWPSAPTFLGTWDPTAGVQAVTVAGDHAYIGEGFTGLTILDVSSPANPQKVGSLTLPGGTWDLVAQSPYLYVADLSDGGRIYSISNPATPTFVGQMSTPHGAGQLLVQGNYSFVMDRSSGLYSFNITNRAAPIQLDHYAPGSNLHPQGFDLSENLLFMLINWSDLRVLDVSNPANLTEIAAFTPAAIPVSICVLPPFAFLGNLDYGLYTYDVSTPQSPQLISILDTPGHAVESKVYGNFLVLCDAYGGTHLINGFEDGTPAIISSVLPDDESEQLAIQGSYVFVASGAGGLTVLRVNLPADADCNGSLEFSDIDAFVLALVSPPAYASAHPYCSIQNLDTNDDGAINGLDVASFVETILD